MDTNEKQTLIQEKEQRIRDLTADLSSAASPIGDWKVIKIYEARMKQEADPYNFEELTAARQAARDEINRLQTEIAELEQ